MNRISTVAKKIKKAVHGIQVKYRKEKRSLARDANRRAKKAETKQEKEILKSITELERLKLERRMYEAKADVIKEKERVQRTRRHIIARTDGGITVKSYGTGFEQFTKGLGSNKNRRLSKDRTRRSK